jgi:membrane protein DedA with SNARE-associated domain
MLAYFAIYVAAILEGEIYYSKVCADAINGYLFWPGVLIAGALGGSTGDQIWFYVLRGRIHWLDRFPRLAAYRNRVLVHVHSNETGLVLSGRFLPGLRTAIPVACAYAGMNPLKFTTLNLISAFAWAGTIMAFVKGGSTTLSAIGLDKWWGPFIPAVLVILFFRWLATRPPRKKVGAAPKHPGT